MTQQTITAEEIGEAIHTACVRVAGGDYRTMALGAARAILDTESPDEALVEVCERAISNRYDLDVSQESLGEAILDALAISPLTDALIASGALTLSVG